LALVYLHNRNDNGNVFYVGIGGDLGRPYEKIGRNKHWHNIVLKCGYSVQITHFDITWEEACSIEKYFINFYGRHDLKKGTLVNLTDGGDGSLGVIFSDERRSKISEKLRGKKFSKERREQMSIRAKDKHKNNPDAINSLNKSNKERYKNKEYSERVKASLLIAMNRPEVKAKIGLSSRKAWEVEGRKEKMRQIVTGRKHSEDTKKLMSYQRMGEKNPNFGRVFTEEQKLNMSKAHLGKVRIQTEEEKLKRSNTMKKKWARIKFEKQTLCNL
jgi:hypothetical protein